jgi:integrase
MLSRIRARAKGSWNAHVLSFLHDKRAKDPVGESWLKRMRWELNRLPTLLSRVGYPARLRSPRDVSAEHIHALRSGLPWESPTFAIHFQALRQFLRWGRNPIALDKSLWRLPSVAPSRRRWLTRDQLVALYAGARGIEKVLIALEGFNGLRRVEVLRLRVKDVMEEEGCLRVLGKGRHGGKWRNIPMQEEVRRVLRSQIRGRAADDRVVPYSSTGADQILFRAAERAGFPERGIRVSHHDLRRTFGRLANASGMNLVSLQGLFGHASPELSAHYIGLDLDELKVALDRLGSFLGPLKRTPIGGSLEPPVLDRGPRLRLGRRGQPRLQ